MLQKPYPGSLNDRVPKDATKIPSHLIHKNGQKQTNTELTESFSKSDLEGVMMRFESLMNELNGG